VCEYRWGAVDRATMVRQYLYLAIPSSIHPSIYLYIGRSIPISQQEGLHLQRGARPERRRLRAARAPLGIRPRAPRGIVGRHGDQSLRDVWAPRSIRAARALAPPPAPTSTHSAAPVFTAAFAVFTAAFAVFTAAFAVFTAAFAVF